MPAKPPGPEDRLKVIEDFIKAIRDGSEPRCNGKEGRRSVAVVEALYRSAGTGMPGLLTEH